MKQTPDNSRPAVELAEVVPDYLEPINADLIRTDGDLAVGWQEIYARREFGLGNSPRDLKGDQAFLARIALARTAAAAPSSL